MCVVKCSYPEIYEDQELFSWSGILGCDMKGMSDNDLSGDARVPLTLALDAMERMEI